jgi:hypothetical protein
MVDSTVERVSLGPANPFYVVFAISCCYPLLTMSAGLDHALV